MTTHHLQRYCWMETHSGAMEELSPYSNKIGKETNRQPHLQQAFNSMKVKVANEASSKLVLVGLIVITALRKMDRTAKSTLIKLTSYGLHLDMFTTTNMLLTIACRGWHLHAQRPRSHYAWWPFSPNFWTWGVNWRSRWKSCQRIALLCLPIMSRMWLSTFTPGSYIIQCLPRNVSGR